MIVCVLLVSNSRGLSPRDRPARRNNTRGSLTPTIHTQSCLIPIITWCHHCFRSNQYSAHYKQFKVWIESNRSLRCHVTTLSRWQVLESPPPPVAKMRVLVFAGDWACEIELRQTSVICFPWRQRSWSCGVLKSWISDATALSNESGNFYTNMIYPCFSRSVCFLWDRLLDEGLAFVQVGVPSCPDDVTLRSCTREFQMWRRRCKTNRTALISGASNEFLVNVINHVVKIVHDI